MAKPGMREHTGSKARKRPGFGGPRRVSAKRYGLATVPLLERPGGVLFVWNGLDGRSGGSVVRNSMHGNPLWCLKWL